MFNIFDILKNFHRRNSTFVMKRCQQKFPTSISPFHSLFVFLILISIYFCDLCMLRNPDFHFVLFSRWCFLFVNTSLPQIVKGIISSSVVCNTCKFISNENIVKTQIYHEERTILAYWMIFRIKEFNSLQVYQCWEILPINQGQRAPFWIIFSSSTFASIIFL